MDQRRSVGDQPQHQLGVYGSSPPHTPPTKRVHPTDTSRLPAKLQRTSLVQVSPTQKLAAPTGTSSTPAAAKSTGASRAATGKSPAQSSHRPAATIASSSKQPAPHTNFTYLDPSPKWVQLMCEAVWNRDDEHEVLAHLQHHYRTLHPTKKAVKERKKAVQGSKSSLQPASENSLKPGQQSAKDLAKASEKARGDARLLKH